MKWGLTQDFKRMLLTMACATLLYSLLSYQKTSNLFGIFPAEIILCTAITIYFVINNKPLYFLYIVDKKSLTLVTLSGNEYIFLHDEAIYIEERGPDTMKFLIVHSGNHTLFSLKKPGVKNRLEIILALRRLAKRDKKTTDPIDGE